MEGISLILSQLNNVPIAVKGPSGTALAGSSGGSITISAWGEGHEYTPTGPTDFEGPIAPNQRPPSLLTGSKYYERSKPQYGSYPLYYFLSARSAGVTGRADFPMIKNSANWSFQKVMALLTTRTLFKPQYPVRQLKIKYCSWMQEITKSRRHCTSLTIPESLEKVIL